MQDQALSGSDYFHLLLDRKMLHNGLVGNISRIHLELEPNANLNSIQKQLSENKTLNTVSRLKVVNQWPLLPVWREEKEERKRVEFHSALSMSEFESSVLNRKVDNNNGLVFIDLCELVDGSKQVVISMHHVLFDHQGMVNFLHALADETVAFPLFPDREKPKSLKVFTNFWFMTFYMLKRSSSKLGTLIAKSVQPSGSPIFKVIEFDENETKQIEANAWQAGSRIGQSAFYISSTAQLVNQVLQSRRENSPYLWFSIPHNQRRKGPDGHLVSNELSFLFFRLNSNELNKTETAVAAINQQLKAQIKDRIAKRYSDLLKSLRFMPMPIYEAMVDLASKGKMSSFGFSDLGTDKIKLNEFVGVQIVNTNHYPPVPSPPGFNVVVSKNNGKLKFVWAYFPEVLSDEEIGQMEQWFKALLL